MYWEFLLTNGAFSPTPLYTLLFLYQVGMFYSLPILTSPQVIYSEAHLWCFFFVLCFFLINPSSSVFGWAGFIVLGMCWAFFFNTNLWGFDSVELIALITLGIIIWATHTQLSISAALVPCISIGVFRLGLMQSFHNFDNISHAVGMGPSLPQLWLFLWVLGLGWVYMWYSYYSPNINLNSLQNNLYVSHLINCCTLI